MTSKVLNEKLNKWQDELNDIREKINKLNDEKTKANTDIQAALKEKNVDKVTSTKQAIERLDEEIEALKLIETEVKRTHPVDPETFRKEYGIFKEQQRDILSKDYDAILKKFSELEELYQRYDGNYYCYIGMLREWQKLAEEIGLPSLLALNNNIQKHRGFRNDLSRLIRVSKGGVI